MKPKSLLQLTTPTGLILLLVLGSVPARAQCPYDINFIEIADRWAEITFQTTAPGANTTTRIAYGEDPQALSQEIQTRAIGNWSGQPPRSTMTHRQRALAGLAPSTSYYFDIRVSNAAGTSLGNWDLCEQQHCPTLGAQPGGYSCFQVGSRRRPRFTTAPAAGTPPLPPNAPSHLPVSKAPPTVNGSTFWVTLDEEKRCTNFQQMINFAGAADPALVHQIVVPPGGVCRPENEGRKSFDLSQKKGPGTVIVRCGADPKMLPPPGVRIDPAWNTPELCHIESNTGDFSADNTPLIRSPANACSIQPCTEGWRFEGFRIGAPDFRKVVRIDWPVLSFDNATGRMVVPGDIRDKVFFNAMQVSLPGLAEGYAHRSCRINSRTYNASANTSEVICGGPSTGTYLGGGFLSDRLATPLAHCEAGVDPICETAEPHLLSNFYEFPLTSIVGDIATTTGPHRLDNFRPVIVKGATGGCNGFSEVLSVNKDAGTARVRPAPPAGCTGGVIQEVGSISMFETAGEGAVDANRVHVVNVIDETHIQLLGSELRGPTVGGWYALDPALFGDMLLLQSCRRCVFDRVLVDGGGPPTRSRSAFNWNQVTNPTTAFATQGAVLSSWIQDFSSWFSTHPVNRTAPRTTVHDVLSATPIVHSITSTKDLQILNVGHYAVPGISVFAQNGNQVCAEDITIERGFFYFPRNRVAGFPEALGRYFPSRHFIEFKCARRIAIRSLELRQNPANGQPSGVPIQISTQNERSIEPPGSTVQDIDISFNLIWDNGGGVDLSGPGDNVSLTESTRRVRVADNLVRTNRPVWNTAPSNQFGEIAEQWGNSPFYGEFMRDISVSTDVLVERNTVGEILGSNSSIYNLDGQFGGTTAIRKNIFAFSGSQFRGVSASSANYVPPPAGPRGYPAWVNHFRRGSVTDPFSTWDNVVVPCVTDAVSPFEQTSKETNNIAGTATSDFACSGGCPSHFVTQVAGVNGQNCRTRQALVFQERADYGYRPPPPIRAMASMWTSYGAGSGWCGPEGRARAGGDGAVHLSCAGCGGLLDRLRPGQVVPDGGLRARLRRRRSVAAAGAADAVAGVDDVSLSTVVRVRSAAGLFRDAAGRLHVVRFGEPGLAKLGP